MVLSGCLRGAVLSAAVKVLRCMSAGSAAAPSRNVQLIAPLTLFYNDTYEVKLPPTHRFPMQKYRMVRSVLERNLKDVRFLESPLASYNDLVTTHCPEYIMRFINGNLTDKENRRIGFPWSEQGVKRALSSVGGIVQAMHTVCKPSYSCESVYRNLVAGQLAGGTHHAFYDRGEGFCVFSDIAVASNVALRDYGSFIRKILIIDLDVHQGNGNAVLFADVDEVFTFSMHCKANYFSKIEKSDIDVEIPAGTGDSEYMQQLHSWIPKLLEEVKPDLIFYQAGVDPLYCDRLGHLKLSHSGLSKRNKYVLRLAVQSSIRTVIAMGGGYPRDVDPSSRDFERIVRAHANVYADAAEAIQDKNIEIRNFIGNETHL